MLWWINISCYPVFGVSKALIKTRIVSYSYILFTLWLIYSCMETPSLNLQMSKLYKSCRIDTDTCMQQKESFSSKRSPLIPRIPIVFPYFWKSQTLKKEIWYCIPFKRCRLKRKETVVGFPSKNEFEKVS